LLRRPAILEEQAMGNWYYCLDHHTVEGPKGCKASQRLGPYETEEEASRALEKVQERNAEWDNDPGWSTEGFDN
jgi:hypothetical protein